MPSRVAHSNAYLEEDRRFEVVLLDVKREKHWGGMDWSLMLWPVFCCLTTCMTVSCRTHSNKTIKDAFLLLVLGLHRSQELIEIVHMRREHKQTWALLLCLEDRSIAR